MAEQGRRRRVISATAAALGAGLFLSASGADVGARPAIVLQQADGLGGDQADPIAEVLGSNPDVSGDGRFVVFQGRPTPAADDQAPDVRDTTIFLTDRDESTTVELTPVPAGLRPGNTVHPVISGDGCTVVAVTEMALDVFRDDDTGMRWDVYRSILPHCGGVVGDWELVSTSSDTSLARDDVSTLDPPAVSRSGTEVLYTHPASHLYEGEELTTVSLVDLAVPVDSPDRSAIVTGMPGDSPNTTFIHAGIDQPAISGDGRYVAYRSDAASAEAVPIWGEGPVAGEPATRQVFVWDREQPDPFLAVKLISVRSTGEPASAGASEPALNRDGRVVTFISPDLGLVPAVFPACEAACPTQVYRLDRDTDRNGWLDEPTGTELSLVSAEPGTDPKVAGTAPSSQPSLSADGELVVFVSKAPNLQLIQAPGTGGAADGDVLLANVTTNDLRRVTVSSDGVRPTVGAHARPAISDTGRTTVFDTLVAGEFQADPAADEADDDAEADEAADTDDAAADEAELPVDPEVESEPLIEPGRQVVALSATPTLSLADADLGTTVVGLESDEWYVAVINEGPSSFTPAEVTISDSHFKINEEDSTCTLGTTVPPGGDCTVRVSFVPTAPTTYSATLTIAEAGYEAVSVSSTVSGAGGEPALRTDPAGADIGLVDIGDSSTEFQFDVLNIGFVPTSVSSVELSGTHPDDFEVTTNNCADRPLNPRASCSVGVTFTPIDSGRRTALVEVSTPEGAYTTMVIAGDARFEPEVALLAREVSAGDEVAAIGTDYPPNSEVTIVFGDDPDEAVTVTTNDEGSFIALVPVAPDGHGGDRTIVVQSREGAAATAPVEVIEDSTQTMIGMPGFGLG